MYVLGVREAIRRRKRREKKIRRGRRREESEKEKIQFAVFLDGHIKLLSFFSMESWRNGVQVLFRPITSFVVLSSLRVLCDASK